MNNGFPFEKCVFLSWEKKSLVRLKVQWEKLKYIICPEKILSMGCEAMVFTINDWSCTVLSGSLGFWDSRLFCTSIHNSLGTIRNYFVKTSMTISFSPAIANLLCSNGVHGTLAGGVGRVILAWRSNWVWYW